MATTVPVARVPFAPLDNPRLQHLMSAKNRQNGVFAQKASPLNAKSSNGTVKAALSPSTSASNKRAYEPSTFDEFDSENVDPAMFDSPSKKSKLATPTKAFTFSLTSSAKAMPPPSAFPSSRMSTPLRANLSSSPRAPSTAPAGRSPKRKMAGIKQNRRISAPFGRVDPPSFGSRGASTLPFSLDAAISGSLPSSTPAPKSIGATIEEAMPKNWFFDIYQDTPDEEAANMMEHSTLTLDLSSDDEDGKKALDDRGKENTPPEGYDAPTASRASAEPTAAAPKHVKKADIIRRKVVVDDMDDGSRSPLSDLETETFIPEGLHKDSHVVVDEVAEEAEKAAAVAKEEVQELFAAPVAEKGEEVVELPVVDSKGDVKGEIIVWEDA